MILLHTSATHFTAEYLPFVLLILVLILYLITAIRQQRRRSGWSGWRTGVFSLGILLLFIAWSPRLMMMAYQDLRVHMVQHLLVGMFAPLGLVLASPITLTLRALPVPASRRIVTALRHPVLRVLNNPFSALLLNIGGMFLLYLTPLFSASLMDMRVHILVHLHFLFAGCLFVWVMLGSDPFPGYASMRSRLIVLFLSFGAHAVLAKIMYAYNLPEVSTGEMAHQIREAAQMMYYGGDVAELALVVFIFLRWYRKQRRSFRSDTLPHQEISVP